MHAIKRLDNGREPFHVQTAGGNMTKNSTLLLPLLMLTTATPTMFTKTTVGTCTRLVTARLTDVNIVRHPAARRLWSKEFTKERGKYLVGLPAKCLRK